MNTFNQLMALAEDIKQRDYKLAHRCQEIARGVDASEMTSTQYKIIGQINIAIQKLGGSFDLLCLVGSFGQSQEDGDVLEMITQYNESGTYMDEVLASVDDTPEDRRSRFKVIATTNHTR